MGIHLTFDKELAKWKWTGFNLVRYYSTESEARADRENIWKQHSSNLESFRLISNLLLSYR